MNNTKVFVNLCELETMFTEEKFKTFLDSPSIYNLEPYEYDKNNWFTSIGGFAAFYNIAGLTYIDDDLKYPVLSNKPNMLMCHEALDEVFGDGFSKLFYFSNDQIDFYNAKTKLNNYIQSIINKINDSNDQDHNSIFNYYLNNYYKTDDQDSHEPCSNIDSFVDSIVNDEKPVPMETKPYLNPVKSIHDITNGNPNLLVYDHKTTSYNEVVKAIEDIITKAKLVQSPYVIYQIEEYERDIVSMLSLRYDFYQAGYDAYLNYDESRLIIRLD